MFYQRSFMKKFFILFTILLLSATPILAENELPDLIQQLEDTVVEVEEPFVQITEEQPKAEIQQEEVVQQDALKEDEPQVFDKEKITEYKTYKIKSVDPKKISKKKNRLEIYTPLYGKTTKTDKKAFEAIIVNNKVVKLNQYNSYIPQNGYVISGYGKARKFILENLFVGADVDIDFKKGVFKVVTHPDNYIYEADYRLKSIKNIFETSDKSKVDVYNMNFYINRSSEILNRTKKLVEFKDFETAKQMANDSMVYSDMAYYSSVIYEPDEFRALWVYPYQKNQEEIEQAFATIVKLGVENIILEGYYNGLTIYPSEVNAKYGLPSQNRYYKDFDVLDAWIKLAQENNKKIYLSFNILNMGNPPKSTIQENIVKIHPQWLKKSDKKFDREKNYYLDAQNSEVQNYLSELVEEVLKKYEIAGINLKDLEYSLAEFETMNIVGLTNKLAQIAQDNNREFLLNVYDNTVYNVQDTAQLVLGENTILLPVLNSSDDDYAKDFLTRVKDVFNSDKIYPIFLEPYQEEKPRKLFDQIIVSRELGLNGIILYNLDYLSKEYIEALKLSIFNKPEEEKEQKSLFEKEEN